MLGSLVQFRVESLLKPFFAALLESFTGVDLEVCALEVCPSERMSHPFFVVPG